MTKVLAQSNKVIGQMTYVERERDIEQYFNRFVKARGGEVRKVKWIGRAHAPDRLALMFRSGDHFLVELKAPGREATAGQAREHKRMRKAGIPTFVLNTIAKIDEFFKKRPHL